MAVESSVQNYFSTTLSSNLGASDLTISVDSIGNLTSPAYIVIDPSNDSKREVIYADGSWGASSFVTSALGNRGLAGSASGAQFHDAGTTVVSVPLAQHLEDVWDEIVPASTGGTFSGDVTISNTTPTLTLDNTGSAFSYDFDQSGDNFLLQQDATNLIEYNNALGDVRFYVDITPDGTGGTVDLGTSTRPWGDGYINRLLADDGSAASPAIAFQNDTDTGLYRSSANVLNVSLAGSSEFAFRAGVFRSEDDDLTDLGSASFRWRDIYAGNGTIQTSDPTHKRGIQTLGEQALDAVKRVAPIAFRWANGSRTHAGFDATDIAADPYLSEHTAVYIDPSIAAEAREAAGPPEQKDDEDDASYESRVAAWREEIAAEKDAPKGLRPTELIPVLWEAVRTLTAKVEALEAGA